MMAQSCGIEFLGNPNKICYTGQKIYGKAIVILEEPKRIKKLKLQILGLATVSFNIGKNHYSDTVFYQDSRADLLTPPSNDEEVTMEAGRHVFEFECDIPAHCPTSFEGHSGSIRYMVKIIFKRPKIHNQTYTIGFTVINSLNLNSYDINLKPPVHEEFIKHMWCGPCKTRPMIIDGRLQKTGYVPGESIPVHLSVKNETSVEIKEIIISLHLIAVSQSRKSVKSNIKDVQKFILGQRKIASNTKVSGEFTETMDIPPAPPTTKTGLCELITISYEIEIQVIIAGPHHNPLLKMPVVIGLIPLGARPLSSPNSCNLGDFDFPPPIYEESTFMEYVNLNTPNELEYSIEETKFIPMYPKCVGRY
ncbi:hypothetical protein ACFFRR_000322 [Megaselia abdita]